MGYGALNLTGECFSQAAADLGGGSPSPRHEGHWDSASKKCAQCTPLPWGPLNHSFWVIRESGLSDQM